MSSASQISAVLDPRMKLSGFSKEEKNVITILINNLSGYISPLIQSEISTTMVRNELSNTREFFKRLCNPISSLTNSTMISSSSNIASDFEKYLLRGLEDNIDPLLWWKMQINEYPFLSQ
jgi:hypothetical protein